ncbi:hypothetical protein EYF80_018946 [Liparis tanakae]|uniref:Uncharacterized protein n=1 Tax=Liparis tanakae TaxID=230148 RepID=A0A4Z2I0Q1_9TELE|nr:hypothetical protein EYF80_018946 [Liparis tanakae]
MATEGTFLILILIWAQEIPTGKPAAFNVKKKEAEFHPIDSSHVSLLLLLLLNELLEEDEY